MRKKKYQKPKVQTVFVFKDVISTSDLYTVDNYDPNEWYDVNAQS